MTPKPTFTHNQPFEHFCEGENMTSGTLRSTEENHPIYYYSNKIYQLSNAMPLYIALGGKFILKNNRRILQYKKNFKNTKRDADVSNFLNTPHYVFNDVRRDGTPEGVIISMSNIKLNHDVSRSKTIFIGHGTGDKKYGGNVHNLNSYDFHFLTGPKHLEKIKDVGLNIPEHKLIKIGNLRFDDYINKTISRKKGLDRLGVIERDRKNVLYAPTWEWGGGTLHKYVYKFAKEITSEHNLIVRPHFHDRKYLFQIKLWARLNHIKHIYFSNPADVGKCDTMEDFMISDIMISDTSSILYEYLITRKPIIVVQTEDTDLHAMPDELNILRYVRHYNQDQHVLSLVNDSLKDESQSEKMDWLLHQCFYLNDGKSVQRAQDFIASILF